MGKNLLSIANSTSKCSAQNLGSKVTNRRRGSFPRDQDQRSRFHFFSNMYCLDASTLLVVYEILCYLLFSISIVIGQFSSNWPGPSSRTVKVIYKNDIIGIDKIRESLYGLGSGHYLKQGRRWMIF